MYIADSHTHCNHSHDSFTPPEEMIENAISKGASYIAMTDHCDKDYALIPEFFDIKQIDLPSHFADAHALRERYKGKIDIAVGLECGYYAPADKLYREILAQYPTDVVINSVHVVNEEDCYYDSYFTRGRKAAYGIYVQAVLDSVNADFPYDVIGHIGYVARKAPFENRALRYEEFPDMFDEILRGIIHKGKALEVNGRGTGIPYIPEDGILRRYKELGGELVTYGSDAHYPQLQLIHYDEVKEGLKALGFKYIFHYLDHKPIAAEID